MTLNNFLGWDYLALQHSLLVSSFQSEIKIFPWLLTTVPSNAIFDQEFFDMMVQCIGGHQEEIEELKLIFYYSPVTLSIGGLVRED
jgi:hypothetical protein